MAGATSDLFDAASSQTLVWSRLMNQTCAAAATNATFGSLSYQFCEMSMMTSQMTFGISQQSYYYSFAYDCVLISQDIIGIITQLQISRRGEPL